MLNEFKSGYVSPRDLLRLAAEIYRKDFKLIAFVGLGVYIPVGLVMSLLASRIDLTALYQLSDIGRLMQMMGMMTAVAAGLAVAVLPLERAALTYLAGQKLNGSEATLGGLMDAAFGNWPRLAAASAIYNLEFFLSLILIIPGVIIGVAYNFAVNIAAAEKAPPLASMAKSAAIVRGRWVRTFLMIIGVWACESSFGIVLGELFGIFFSALPQAQGAGVTLHALNVALRVSIEIVCILFKLVAALYFFNLYYTAAPQDAFPSQDGGARPPSGGDER